MVYDSNRKSITDKIKNDRKQKKGMILEWFRKAD